MQIKVDEITDILRRQIRLGRTLRARLASRGWRVVNDTTLPLVCFVPNLTQDRADDAVGHILTTVLASGEAWLSTVACHGRLALRACITSYETTDEDVDRLVELLDSARAEAMAALA
jgi:glutamate/tyrosine decarboxylase-like PLP-dependent enzyme